MMLQKLFQPIEVRSIFFCATFSTLGQAASGKSRAQAMEKLFQFENLRLDFRSLSIALSTANITKVI